MGVIKCFLPPQPRVRRKEPMTGEQLTGYSMFSRLAANGKICLGAMDPPYSLEEVEALVGGRYLVQDPLCH